MKIRNLSLVLGLACAATAAQAQFMVTVMSDQPIVIGQLVPPQSSISLNPTGKAMMNTSSQIYTSSTPVPAVKKIRQPDVRISNPSYMLDCYEKSPGICERIADLLEQYGRN